MVVAMLLAGRSIEGHAILKESSPAANSSVAGPDVPIMLKFNVRVDAARSRLQLLGPDNATTNLVIAKQTSPDTVTTTATGLRPAAYKIEWQVLASDGHITRGLVPFNVTGS
jgi:methionine-rich copper-binding protein CopC